MNLGYEASLKICMVEQMQNDMDNGHKVAVGNQQLKTYISQEPTRIYYSADSLPQHQLGCLHFVMLEFPSLSSASRPKTHHDSCDSYLIKSLAYCLHLYATTRFMLKIS